jgi:hypothetical protein
MAITAFALDQKVIDILFYYGKYSSIWQAFQGRYHREICFNKSNKR